MNNKFCWMTTKTTKNIGDDFQCIATKDLLEGVEIVEYVDRENMNKYNGDEAKIIANGWYMHNPLNWPISKELLPLLISIHISNTKQSNGYIPSKIMLNKKNITYLLENDPVGCRDTFTYNLLKSKGICAYFSGCMTLTLKTRCTKKEDYICLVDPTKKLEKFIRSKTNREIRIVRPECDDWSENYDERIKQAEDILKIYSNAHMVITSRLHGALPSLAMGTNVLLLEGKFGDERFEGIKYFLNYTTYDDLYSGKYPLNLEKPINNPTEYNILRKNLIKITKAFINNEISKINFEEINNENLEALKNARNRTIKLFKDNKLESINFREKKNKLRFVYRNIENIIK